MILVFNLFSFL